ncbi:DUF397 domain-containing protein [Streptomyces sp. NPDC005438]|uniref:DUF397 domain-containing protein n=1 Tax=Streptomyces sp. NPDC005438 TaxID=3156880 RepID=UPI0033BF37A5
MNEPIWHKPSHSTNGGACVEVATNLPTTLVRDSKTPHGPQLTLTPEAWTTFTQKLKA